MSKGSKLREYTERNPRYPLAFRYEGTFHLEVLGPLQRVRKAHKGCEIVTDSALTIDLIERGEIERVRANVEAMAEGVFS